jgi:putative transport protein
MQSLIDLLVLQPLLLLFAVIGLGYLVGSIRVFGFSLGPAAVLFAGIAFGALDPRLKIIDLIYILGLILFVYTLGLQSGPTFFSSFGPRAFRANLIAFVAIALGAFIAYLSSRLFAINPATVTGVFCGALTNTPALAASVETIRTVVQQQPVSASTLKEMVAGPVIGYGVSYPFGVIGVLLAFWFFGRIWRRIGLPVQSPVETSHAEGAGPIAARTFRVSNPGIVGKAVSVALSLHPNAGFVLSRLRRGEETSLVYGETVLRDGDLVVAVGESAALERALTFFGEEASEQIQTENTVFDFRRIEVSDRKVIGRTIASLRLQELLDATITRIRRGDVDFVPTSTTVLERGDRVRVITWSGNLERVAKFFGDSVRLGTEMDFLSLSLGVVLGILFGMVPLPLPGGSTFTLGFAGGPLVAGLVFGRIARTGPITWTMPFAVNLTVRQIGLVLFLAGIGTKAGEGFLPVLLQGGWKLMVVGAVITASVTCVTMCVAARMLKVAHPEAMGMMSGIQTQPACLAYATEQTLSNAPNVWYASVYPVSMISKLILAQLLISHLF